MTHIYTGSCLCGSVTYEAKGAPLIVAKCHCTSCRKTSGAGHTVGAMFPAAAVTLNGDLGAYHYTSDLGSRVTRSSCAICATPICGTNSRTPDHMTIALGSMDDANDLAVQVVVFNRDRQHWDDIAGDVAVYETQPDWTPPPAD